MSNLSNDFEIHTLDEGSIWRNKRNPDDFSRWLRLGIGRSIDEYEQVPIEVYENHLKEQEGMSILYEPDYYKKDDDLNENI